MINNLKAFGKFLDQPILISKLSKAMPAIMTAGAAAFLAKDTKDTFEKTKDKNERKKTLLQHSIVLTSAIASALLAPKIASKVTNRPLPFNLEKAKQRNTELIDEFIAKENPKGKTLFVLNKAKEKALSLGEVKTLLNKYKNTDFAEKLIPDPENIKAKDIFSEIGYLSVYGAIPVAGGILGGVAADKLTEENYKEKIPDKINEGIYQYLANIFMCNIGAGAALGILEAFKIQSKAARAMGMVAGIILTGIVGGSKIANLFSQKVLSPILCHGKKQKERTPELMDMGMHTDDIATVSLLSGLKWIEPALPILYSVSGYKAGVGYRN